MNSYRDTYLDREKENTRIKWKNTEDATDLNREGKTSANILIDLLLSKIWPVLLFSEKRFLREILIYFIF